MFVVYTRLPLSTSAVVSAMQVERYQSSSVEHSSYTCSSMAIVCRALGTSGKYDSAGFYFPQTDNYGQT